MALPAVTLLVLQYPQLNIDLHDPVDIPTNAFLRGVEGEVWYKTEIANR